MEEYNGLQSPHYYESYWGFFLNLWNEEQQQATAVKAGTNHQTVWLSVLFFSRTSKFWLTYQPSFEVEN